MTPQLTLNPIADSYLVAIGVAVALLLLWYRLPLAASLASKKLRILTAIRCAMLLVLLFVLLRPTLVYVTTTKQAATVIMLFDRSRSMSVPDELNGLSRYDAMLRAVSQAAPRLNQLAEEVEIRAYAFDAETSPMTLRDGVPDLPSSPEGPQTAIGAALEDVLRIEAGKRVMATLLFSDGAQRALYPRDALPQPAAMRMKSLDQRLFAFRFGKARGAAEARDLALEDLSCPDRVFVKNELTITVRMRAAGYAGQTVAAQLLYETEPGKMEVVDSQEVQITGPDERIPVRFRYTPETPGERKIAVTVAPQPGETSVLNNEQSTVVNVMEGGIRVLYLEGSLRVEQRFLRRSLDSSPDIQTDFLRPTAPPDGGDPSGLAERFRPGRYDVYIIGDIDSTFFRSEWLTELAETVSRGSGLLMLGGFQSFGAGGYAETPLAEVLPVRLNRLERQDPGAPLRADLHLPGPLQFVPTDIGLQHFALTLAASPEESRRLWGTLPPLDGANRISGIKPGALVLAEDSQKNPLLVVQFYGNGRTAAFAADSTWRWWMHGEENIHKRFWRQLVLWLAGKDESRRPNVWIRPVQRRILLGESFEFEAGANDEAGEPIPNAVLEATIRLPDGRTENVAFTDGEGRASARFRRTDQAGDYLLTVRATVAGRELGTRETRFLVVTRDLEMDQPAADPTLLASLASTTGGELLPPEQLPELLDRLLAQTKELEVPIVTRRTLWDTWPILVIFTLLATSEWYLRKRWGLV
ncbi:hypothetical protein [Thermopirellula anaerolimosa]